jgi:hypothetical protein
MLDKNHEVMGSLKERFPETHSELARLRTRLAELLEPGCHSDAKIAAEVFVTEAYLAGLKDGASKPVSETV